MQDHTGAIALNEQSLELAAAIETADTEITSNAPLNLVDSLVALGRLAEAAEQYRAVEGVVRNPRPQDRWMLWRYAQHLFHSVGELSFARGDVDAALAYADECLRSAERSGSVKNIVKARRLRGQGLSSSHPAVTDTMLEVLRQGGACKGMCARPRTNWRTLCFLRENSGIRLSSGKRGLPLATFGVLGPEAREAYREAVHVIRSVADGFADERLKEMLLSSAEVQHVLEWGGG